MATYKEIHGINIQYRDSDATAVEGDVWYNASTGLLKMHQSSGSWAAGGTLNTNERAMSAGFGLQTAAICVGGITSPGGVTDVVEQYNGSAWSEVGDINTARGTFAGGGGTSSSSVVAGGSPNLAICESWNDSTWTEVANLTTGRQAAASCGTSNTAALIASGNPNLAIAELWNGASWSEVADLSTARQAGASAGTSTTSALFSSGTTDGGSTQPTQSEEWTAADFQIKSVTTS